MRASKKPLSLRTTLSAATVGVATLALLACGALIVLTTIIHRTAVGIGASVESVSLAEEAQIALLLHARVRDPLVRRGIEGELQQRLDGARGFVTTEDEARAFSAAQSLVSEYIASTRDEHGDPDASAVRHSAAYSALERLAAINLAQSRAARAEAARWDELGDLLGAGVGAAVILVAGWLLVWLRARAFRPMLRLADAMERFGRGDGGARAEPQGPAELQAMSAVFNQMADSISAQRQQNMAFVAGVAHDLRNPLSAAQLSIALLSPDRALPEEQRIRTVAERVQRQLTAMDRLLGDFLDMARIHGGVLELKTGVHDSRQLVERALALFEGHPRAHELHVSLPAEPVPLECDHQRFEQVVTNLVSNAVKYSAPGSPVSVRLERGESHVVLEVTDRGIGISSEQRALAFEPFRRAAASRDAVPGVGLGLFVVRRIVEAHGGQIELESTPGHGSTFRVRLPLEAVSPAAGPC